MKIRNRLTLQFALLAGIILIAVLLTVYWITALITRNEFNDRLKERADIAAKIFLEKDELNKSLYETFEKKYLKTLPHEVVQIFNQANEKSFIDDNPSSFFPITRIEQVRKQKVLYYLDGDMQIVGQYYNDNQGDFVIFVSAIDVYGEERLYDLRILIAVASIISVLILFIVGRVFSKNALKPISAIVHQAQQIGASNLHLRLDKVKYNDEIGEMSDTFNDMLERLEGSFISQRNFVSSASHELKTPLTSIIGELQVFLSRERSTEEYKEALQSVLGDAQQMNELVSGLLNLAYVNSNSKIAMEEIRIDEILLDVVTDIQREDPLSEVQLFLEQMPEDPSMLVVKGNRSLLIIAFQNLIRNAIKFSGNQLVTIRLYCVDGNLIVTFADKGIGIESNDLKAVFQPFYRTKKAREFKGHGIGLALVDKIRAMHHALIYVESTPGKGTVFTWIFDLGVAKL